MYRAEVAITMLGGSRRALAACLAGAICAATPALPASATQTKSFVVSWFHIASYRQDGDCPTGLVEGESALYRRILTELNYSQADIDSLTNLFAVDPFQTDAQGRSAALIGTMRGRIDGKPANIYNHPESGTDSHIPTSQGHYANGFNLDGRGAASPNSFEDPDTHELGVNNQLYRATGCIKSVRARMPERPEYPSNEWNLNRNIMPAWLVSIAGDDLSKDGDVTITFDKALEHATLDAQLETLHDATYRIDPDPRSHVVARGRIKDGVVSAIEPFHLKATFDAAVYPEFDLFKTHLRVKLNSDGTAEGYMGGYQPWIQPFFLYDQGGLILETQVAIDIPGYYYALKRLADGDPDPKTGQNTTISSTYRIDMVPAFTVPVGALGKVSQIGQTSQIP